MRPSDFVANQTEGIKWLSFSPLNVYPFLFHGFVVKGQNSHQNTEKKEVERWLQKVTSRKAKLISPSQRHRDECVVITSKDRLKRRYQGDALLTDRNDVLICVAVADCVPIFLVDTERRVIGLIHAGWRGTLLGIVRRTLDVAKDQLGCRLVL